MYHRNIQILLLPGNSTIHTVAITCNDRNRKFYFFCCKSRLLIARLRKWENYYKKNTNTGNTQEHSGAPPPYTNFKIKKIWNIGISNTGAQHTPVWSFMKKYQEMYPWQRRYSPTYSPSKQFIFLYIGFFLTFLPLINFLVFFDEISHGSRLDT